MVSHTRLKTFLTGLAIYTLAGLAVGYFGVNAYTGKYGLNAQHELDQEIVALTSELGRLKDERLVWERKVALMRSEGIDPDILDERARAQLNFVHPSDIVRLIKAE